MLLKFTVPKSGLIKPVIRLNIVDFPAPFGPNKHNTSPLLILKFILSRICLFPKEKEIFLRETNGVFFLKDFIVNFFIIAILFI